MTGALITLLSSTIANGLPTFSRVASPKRRAPTESNLKLTTGSLSWNVACASTSMSPPTMTRLRTTYASARRAPRSSCAGRISSPGGSRPRRASSTLTLVSTSWKVSLAVRPSSALTCSGLSTPGSCTRMRSWPSRWIVGSLVPVSSMRRRMISIDCVDGLAAARLGRGRAEAHRAGAVRGDLDGEVGVELAREPAARPRSGPGSRIVNDDRVALDCEPGIADLRVAQRVAHALLDRVEALALGRGDIDLEQQIRAAAQVETERHLLVRQPARQRARAAAR